MWFSAKLPREEGSIAQNVKVQLIFKKKTLSNIHILKFTTDINYRFLFLLTPNIKYVLLNCYNQPL